MARKHAKINHEIIKNWIKLTGSASKAHLSIKADISTSAIEKMAAGQYDFLPNPKTRAAMAKTIGVDEKTLFPGIEALSGKSRVG